MPVVGMRPKSMPHSSSSSNAAMRAVVGCTAWVSTGLGLAVTLHRLGITAHRAAAGAPGRAGRTLIGRVSG